MFDFPGDSLLGPAGLHRLLGVGEGVVGEFDGLLEQREFGLVFERANLFDDLIGLDERGSLAGGQLGVDVSQPLVSGHGHVVGLEAEPAAPQRLREFAPPLVHLALHVDDFELGRLLCGLIEVAEVGC